MDQHDGEKYQVWPFLMLKGGIRKTTSAWFVAQGLARSGANVLLIDADSGTQGVTDWATRVWNAGSEPAFFVRQWTPRLGLLVEFVREQQANTGARYVIIDVGAEFPEVARQAAMISTMCVMPVGAEQAELARLSETSRLIEQANPLAARLVLLTRVPQPRRGVAQQVRELLTGEDYVVLNVEITHNRDRYAHVFGKVVVDLGEYDPLIDELVDIAGTGL
jgi:cellulose biosynthesis protein BcsQ